MNLLQIKQIQWHYGVLFNIIDPDANVRFLAGRHEKRSSDDTTTMG